MRKDYLSHLTAACLKSVGPRHTAPRLPRVRGSRLNSFKDGFWRNVETEDEDEIEDDYDFGSRSI